MHKTMNENWEDMYVDNDSFSYSYYQGLVNKYLKTDWREIIFQNRVVTLLLDSLFLNEKDISIIDISLQNDRNDSGIHTTRFYKTNKASSPDLLVARHWNYANIDNDIDYLGVVEVKSPHLDPIYNKNKLKYEIQKQIKKHLDTIDKVILTDCIEWQFFEKGYGLEPVKTIKLFDENNNWKRKDGKLSKFIIKELQTEPNYEEEPEEWTQLCLFLRKFLIRN